MTPEQLRGLTDRITELEGRFAAADRVVAAAEEWRGWFPNTAPSKAETALLAALAAHDAECS
jgi:hypothetical protein